MKHEQIFIWYSYCCSHTTRCLSSYYFCVSLLVLTKWTTSSNSWFQIKLQYKLRNLFDKVNITQGTKSFHSSDIIDNKQPTKTKNKTKQNKNQTKVKPHLTYHFKINPVIQKIKDHTTSRVRLELQKILRFHSYQIFG